MITVAGTISADGENGEADACGPGGGDAHRDAAGGGGGGSILMVADEIDCSGGGTISVKGGDGGVADDEGGGGGDGWSKQTAGTAVFCAVTFDGGFSACSSGDGVAISQLTGVSPLVTVECGNGTKSSFEKYDDGNLVSGDGCDSSCRTEGGYSCVSLANIALNGDFELGDQNFTSDATVSAGFTPPMVNTVDFSPTVSAFATTAVVWTSMAMRK
ncbi:MAG: hypothetical protein R3C68_17850 [Myxococcota bacterium]